MNTPEINPFNLSDAEFDAVITEIDTKLRQRSTRVPGREVLAFAEYSAKFNVAIRHDHPTAKRIFAWFDRTYGDRLRPDWDFGRTVVLVKGDVCKMRIIRFYWRDATRLFSGVDGHQTDSGTRGQSAY
jgi:hypothetical protein